MGGDVRVILTEMKRFHSASPDSAASRTPRGHSRHFLTYATLRAPVIPVEMGSPETGGDSRRGSSVPRLCWRWLMLD